ncbi:ABC transporter substrate-binding protein [Mariniluteicoccus flavus]
MRDPKFRHALGYAIDRDLIANNAYQGGGAPGQTIIPSTYPAYHAAPKSPYTFDLAKAAQLLDEAGYKVGADGRRTMPDGKPIGTLRFYGDAKSDSATSSMKYLQEWFGKVGIETRPEPMDTNRMSDQISAGTYDIFHWGWAVRPDPDAMLSFITRAARSGSSDTFFCNPDYDKLYEAQHGEQDRAKRVALIKEMQELAFTQAPNQVLVFNKTSDAWRTDRIEGFVPRPAPDGSLLLGYGAGSLMKVHPVAAKAASAGGTSPAVIGGVAAGVLVLGAGAFFLLRNRKRTVDERE